MIGFALTGSYCTIADAIILMEELVRKGYEILPIMSENAYGVDTRFGKAADIQKKIENITGKTIIHSIVAAEPLGPKVKLDALIVCPCKAHLRNDKPLVLALATNDALSGNLKNIGTLMSRKNVYFTPMKQDDPQNKPHSLVAEFDMVEECLKLALDGKQIPKIFI